MRDDRVLRILRPSLALAALAALVVLLGLAIAGPAHAGSKSTPVPTPADSGAIVLQRGAEVQFGEDVLVPRGTKMPSVVVFGGDITVNGRVTDAVVAFGGDVKINGTVGTSTVAFGGDVTLGPKSVVGRDLKPGDASLVLFGGKLTVAPGATVVGQTKTFDSVGWNNAVGWAAKGLFVNPLWGFSFVGWVVQTAFFLVLALVAAALMPRQLRSVQRHLGRKPWASLGWGALVLFIVAPAVLFVLIISVIGLLLVLPYGLFVLLAYFFVTTGVASFLAQKVLTGFGGKENLMLAVTLGVIGTTVVSRIPVAGPVLLTAMMIFGVGAAALGFAEWRRGKREAAAVAAGGAAAVPAAAAYPAPSDAATMHPADITPIVQTSPPPAVGDVTGVPGTVVTEVAAEAGTTGATVPEVAGTAVETGAPAADAAAAEAQAAEAETVVPAAEAGTVIAAAEPVEPETPPAGDDETAPGDDEAGPAPA